MKLGWEKADSCDESVLAPLDALLANAASTPRVYARSPIFLITDALPNVDDADEARWTRFVQQHLAAYESPIFTFFYRNAASCNNTRGGGGKKSAAYGRLRELARYTHGVTNYIVLNKLAEALLSSAMQYYTGALLGARDFMSACMWSKVVTSFYVDKSVSASADLIVELYGGSIIQLQLVSGANNRRYDGNPDNTRGDDLASYRFSLRNKPRGPYRIESYGGRDDEERPCHARVYVRSKRSAFFGSTTSLGHDRERAFVPLNTPTHLVGLISELALDVHSVKSASLTISSLDETVEPPRDRRLYASSGTLRPAATFNFLFDKEFTCNETGALDVRIGVTLANGDIVQRATTSQCAPLV